MDDNNLFYFSAAKGYRIGGTNAPLSSSCIATNPDGSPALGSLGAQGYSQAPQTYASDNVWSYELGAKSKFFDRRLEIDASVYHIEWSKYSAAGLCQRLRPAVRRQSRPGRKQRLRPAVRAHPAHGLTFDGSVGYGDATYSKTINKDPGVALNVVTKGDHLDTNPFSGTLGITYERPVLGTATATPGSTILSLQGTDQSGHGSAERRL